MRPVVNCFSAVHPLLAMFSLFALSDQWCNSQASNEKLHPPGLVRPLRLLHDGLARIFPPHGCATGLRPPLRRGQEGVCGVTEGSRGYLVAGIGKLGTGRVVCDEGLLMPMMVRHDDDDDDDAADLAVDFAWFRRRPASEGVDILMHCERLVVAPENRSTSDVVICVRSKDT
ncbi:hypothetical protein V8C44DRAFT_104223 [Trichoderma aethiopicum]